MDDWSKFLSALFDALNEIPKEYIEFAVAGAEAPIYRERVFCYELYHQLRLSLEDKELPLTLTGEVDKAAHPIINERFIPDLLLHELGSMKRNFVAIEVKPVGAAMEGVRKDIENLHTLLQRFEYRHAIFLVYGSDETLFRKIKDSAHATARQCEADLSRLVVVHHRGARRPTKALVSW